MVHDMVALIAQYGLLLVFLNVLVEQAGLPVPAVPTLVTAGALSGDGQRSLAMVLLVAVVACLLADLAWYAAGRRYGGGVLRLLCRISLSPDSCVRQSELRFQRWGGRLLLIAKFVPGLSTVAPPLAGATGVRLAVFGGLDVLGSLLWAGTALVLRRAFAHQIDHALALLASAGVVAAELLVGLLLLYIFAKWWQRRRLLLSLRMARIGVDELHEQVVSGQAPLVVDVRSPVARQLDARVIPGALLIDPDGIAHELHAVPPKRELVLYCNCPNEISAARAAKVLMRRGYRHVRPLQGGLDAWAAAGYPVEYLPEIEGAVTHTVV